MLRSKECATFLLESADTGRRGSWDFVSCSIASSTKGGHILLFYVYPPYVFFVNDDGIIILYWINVTKEMLLKNGTKRAQFQSLTQEGSLFCLLTLFFLGFFTIRPHRG